MFAPERGFGFGWPIAFCARRLGPHDPVSEIKLALLDAEFSSGTLAWIDADREDRLFLGSPWSGWGKGGP